MSGIGYTIASDSSGNVYGGGSTNLTVWKIDSNGNLVWQRGYASGGGAVNGIAVNSSGAIAVAGKLESNNYTVILKINADGSLAWSRQLNKTGNGNGVAIDASGNVWACGTDTQTSSNPFGSWIAKFDTNGNQAWTHRLVPTPAGFILAKAVAVDSSGNSYFSGWDNGQNGNWMLKYNSSGSLQWQKIMSRTNSNAYNAYGHVSIGGSGNLYLNDYGEGFVKIDQSGVQLLSRKAETASNTLVNGWLYSSASSDDMVQLMGTAGALKVNGDGSGTGTYPGIIYSAGSYSAGSGAMSFSSNYYSFIDAALSAYATSYSIDTTKASTTIYPIG